MLQSLAQFWSRVGFSVRWSATRTGGPCHYPTDSGFLRQNFTVEEDLRTMLMVLKTVVVLRHHCRRQVVVIFVSTHMRYKLVVRVTWKHSGFGLGSVHSASARVHQKMKRWVLLASRVRSGSSLGSWLEISSDDELVQVVVQVIHVTFRVKLQVWSTTRSTPGQR
ncbi:hypothetical protein HanRHA438_Chr12g0567321 [Helianthus annuus]|nr:hypothetical protein HanIR_Chr12g0600071 [Helianthus annuus]KAJ0867800.1 hypothetical protein HanRHA438_Chr12g0567321 [Helianthus annuus]